MTTDGEVLVLAFGSEFGVPITDDTRFGSTSLGVVGASDGAHGAQWNSWIDLRDDVAYVGVNLEGKVYDGWPVARFIERELGDPRLFKVIPIVGEPRNVQILWYRDAWQSATRPAIAEQHIGVSRQTLPEVTPDGWRAILQEALECLDAGRGHRGRGRQVVTVKRGRVEHEVSPHLQFRARIASQASQRASWRPGLVEARRLLQPLYDYVTNQSRP